MSQREPLHQAPNAQDLRRVPPATSECAVIRGLFRDFADADLGAEGVSQVEDHVHGCRTCAVELSRAEHESLRLRRAFAAMGTVSPRLPAGFAAKVVNRLVLDETSMVRPEALAAAVAGARSMQRAATVAEAPPARRGVAPLGILFFATMLLVVLVGSIAVIDAGAAGPKHVARLIVVDAHGLADDDGRSASGLGEHQALRVGRGGGARVDWHDVSTKLQPAASLAIHGEGEVRLVDGRPLLVNGNVEVSTNRHVSIPIADGSRLDLGVGEYVLSVEAPDWVDPSLPSVGQAAFAAAPADLFVTVEVRRGDSATVVRSVGNTVVKAGQTGIYQGSSSFVPYTNGVDANGNAEVSRVGAPVPVAAPELSMSGYVQDAMGNPALGAEVRLSFGLGVGVQNISKVSADDGSFVVPVDRAFDSGFAIASAFAGGVRPDLGMVAPNAVPLARHGNALRMLSPMTLGLSVPLVGSVVDDLAVARSGVTVVPCIVDELFGHVLALTQFRTSTGPAGNFRIERLPSALPPHQALVLLLLHGSLEPTVVSVPQRGGQLAMEPLAPAVMARLRTIRLHLLSRLSTIHIYEEIDGLPVGTAALHRTVVTDGNGCVNTFAVGRGRLWLRGGAAGAPMLRDLVMDEVVPLPQYRLSQHLPMPLGSVFRALQAIPDTGGAEVANGYRHQRFSLRNSDENGDLRVGRAADGFGRPVGGAQVFAADATGPRGCVDSRFLGFTAADGSFPCGSLSDNSDLLVIADDGSVGLYRNAGSASVPVVPLLSSGRVQLGDSLREESVSGGFMTIRFERLDATVDGMRPVAVRFVSAATAWEVGDLPPGSYRATLGSTVYHVVVPETGFAVLH